MACVPGGYRAARRCRRWGGRPRRGPHILWL